MRKFVISLSPHIHTDDSVERNMYGVVMALVPALLMSFWVYGIGSVAVVLSSVASSCS